MSIYIHIETIFVALGLIVKSAEAYISLELYLLLAGETRECLF
jgi:hypothetical protein